MVFLAVEDQKRKRQRGRAAQKLLRLEKQTRSGDQIAKCCGDQDLPHSRLRVNLFSDVHGDAANELLRNCAFAGMQPSRHLETKRRSVLSY